MSELEIGNKITIGDAFKLFDTIEIEYLQADYCDLCQDTLYLYDWDNSFSGTLEDFKEHMKTNGCFDLVTKIEYSYNNVFRFIEDIFFESQHNEHARCKICSDKLIALKNVEYIRETMKPDYATKEGYPTFETTETKYTEVEKRQ